MDALWLQVTAHRATSEASEAVSAARDAIGRAIVAAKAASLAQGTSPSDTDVWDALDSADAWMSGAIDALDVLAHVASGKVTALVRGESSGAAPKRARKPRK